MAKKASEPKASVSKTVLKPANIVTEMTTPVRGTPIPKTAKPVAVARPLTHDMIAYRAYEISQSQDCGSEFDNWCRAERELKGV